MLVVVSINYYKNMYNVFRAASALKSSTQLFFNVLAIIVILLEKSVIQLRLFYSYNIAAIFYYTTGVLALLHIYIVCMFYQQSEGQWDPQKQWTNLKVRRIDGNSRYTYSIRRTLKRILLPSALSLRSPTESAHYVTNHYTIKSITFGEFNTDQYLLYL